MAHKPGPRLSLKFHIDVISLPVLLFVCIASSLTLQIKPFFGRIFAFPLEPEDWEMVHSRMFFPPLNNHVNIDK